MCGMRSLLSEKEIIRRKIWMVMDKSGVSRFPKPVFGRIPNFAGAEEAARRLAEQVEFKDAKVVKVNPDAPQRSVRMRVLSAGKVLMVPSPRLRKGFMLLESEEIPKRFYAEASTIKGSFKYGRFCSLHELLRVDLIVAGSVAVSIDGARIGKGGGYSEIEYGILRELGLVEEKTLIFTTVHDVQFVDKAPREPHDFTVDAIVTPTRVIRIRREDRQPRGILWEKIAPEQLESMPILLELKEMMNTI